MIARETMRFAARFFYSGPKEAIEARIEETLELVGLKDKADRPIKAFPAVSASGWASPRPRSIIPTC